MNPSPNLLSNITIVLINPKYPENIGAAARIALNMGISQLTVISRHRPEENKMKACATHNAASIINAIKYFTNTEEALRDYQTVIGTTARTGRGRLVTCSPRQLFSQIAPLLPNNKVAILFGPENRGLDNNELGLCSMVTKISTADFSSLNLAQAVAVICYELHEGFLQQNKEDDNTIFHPRLASLEEQEAMHRHIDDFLSKIDSLNGKTRNQKRHPKIRLFLGRLKLQAKETRLVSEICRQAIHILDKND